AVKILKEEFARNESFVLKFKSEAQAAARLSHPNIVNIFDVGEDNGQNFIVMEYVEGTTLKDYIDDNAPLPPDDIVRIASQICDALATAHEKGVIHRDIKPHNILITPEGTAKVADFGIARAVSNMTITYSGNMVGSVHYVSPEQARGEAVDKTSDIYSLGCVMYEMATGRVPFDADSPVTVALKHIHEEPKSPKLLNEAIPRELEEVIMTAIDKNPTYRFQSAQDMKMVLQEILYGSSRGKNYKRTRPTGDTLIMPPVTEEENDVPARKIRPLGYIIFAAIALLGLWLGIQFSPIILGLFFPKEVSVPSIVGMSAKEAETSLSSSNLKMIILNRVHSATVEKDHIVSQQPAAGEKVKEGREIQVTLSSGSDQVEVSNLVGKSVDEVQLILRNQGLELGRIDKIDDPDTPEGVVISQEPAKGDMVDPGKKIDVVVSSGAESAELQMPNLVGTYLSEARVTLQNSGLVLDKVDKQDSDQYFPGQIISQSVASGAKIQKNAKVSVVQSTGPGPMPKTQPLRFTMPANSDYAVLSVILTDAKGRREIYNNTHLGGYEFARDVEYYGKGEVIFYVDGQAMLKQELQ
ncbi:MAG: Stk1 family PASTA domain-containing Ser/Thr kinase, partial [Candidatus Saccharibacteria bacterium]